MLLVKTYLQQTVDKGIGLFAKEAIVKGTEIYKVDHLFCRLYTFKEYGDLHSLQQQFVTTYGIPTTQGWLLDLDNARFVNHSQSPNISFSEYNAIALRDIEPGEELTCDYKELCGECIDFEVKE